MPMLGFASAIMEEGDFARYLCTDTWNIPKIVDMGLAFLASNFDRNYPAEQATDDDQNLEVLDLLWKSAK